MVAYNFHPRFADAVARGEKRQTIRALRKNGHASPGDRLQLYTGMRTKHCRKLVTPDPVCRHNVFVGIGHDKIEIAFPFRFPIAHVCAPNHLNKFARNDGFDDFAEMRNWFIMTHGPLPFRGVKITWDWPDDVN